MRHQNHFPEVCGKLKETSWWRDCSLTWARPGKSAHRAAKSHVGLFHCIWLYYPQFHHEPAIDCMYPLNTYSLENDSYFGPQDIALICFQFVQLCLGVEPSFWERWAGQQPGDIWAFRDRHGVQRVRGQRDTTLPLGSHLSKNKDQVQPPRPEQVHSRRKITKQQHLPKWWWILYESAKWLST